VAVSATMGPACGLSVRLLCERDTKLVRSEHESPPYLPILHGAS
jgi:hypothetical protein